MSDVTTGFTWIEANQSYLSNEFVRLRGKLGGLADGEVAPASRPVELAGQTAIDWLAELFGLSPFEREVLLLCAGVEMDAELAQCCARALGRAQTHATFGLALSVLDAPHWSAITPMGPLRRWRLLEIERGSSLACSPLRIDERVLHFLAGVGYMDPRLQPLVRRSVPQDVVPERYAALAAEAIAALRRSEEPLVIQLVGDDAHGQQDVAGLIAGGLGLQLHAMSSEDVSRAPGEVEALAALWDREAVLLPSALLLRSEVVAPTPQILEFTERVRGLLLIAGREPLRLRCPTLRIDVEKSDFAEQRLLWHRALGPDAQRSNGVIDLLASHFRLSAQAIRGIAEQHRRDDGGSDKPARGLWALCRAAGPSRIGELAQRILSAARWEDLVLPEAQMATLRQIVAHVRQRATVYEQWGFAGRGSRCLGISVLFAGESGTGKTMAAEVLANELDLDLYRIDLAAVVSKYIGETEKNLRRVFDAAEDSGAILLFDEADALFGKRSDVKDSHDRYANIEVSYLLQRMEAYRGLAILTTNMKSAMDTAFQRRLRFVITFPFPDAQQRGDIWRRVFPADTPVRELDYGKLASLHVAGGEIRNIALNAAFLAANGHAPVDMSHLLVAAHGEYGKLKRARADAETRGWV